MSQGVVRLVLASLVLLASSPSAEHAAPFEAGASPADSAPAVDALLPALADLDPVAPDEVDALVRSTRQQVRELVYVHAKEDAGAPPDLLQPALEILDAEATEHGVVDMEIVRRVTDEIHDSSSAQLAEALLVGWAEYVAFGQVVDGRLPDDAQRVASRTSKRLALARMADVGGIGDDPGGLLPNLGGVCKTCTDVTTGTGPDFVIGAFPPAGTFATHSSTLSGSGDCNWYAFTVQCGHRYEFRTCLPGSSNFDSVLQVFNGSCASLVAADDNCSGKESIEIVPASGVTTIYLKISAFGSGSGSYTLGYQEQPCPNCTNATKELNPTTTCQYVNDCFVNCTGACLETWWRVNLVGGQGYMFTTCPNAGGGVCPSAAATPTTFDTELFLYELAQCPGLGVTFIQSTGTGSCVGTGQTNRAVIQFNAPYTGTFLLRLRGPALGNGRFGCYTLGFVQTTVPTCATCQLGPFEGTLTPTSTCQTVSGIVTTCQDTWYRVNVTFLSNYEFSTCSVVGGCLGGTASFDSKIALHRDDASCTLLQSDDDGCGGQRSLFCTSTGAGPLSPGTYKLHVFGGASTGSFVLTYRSCGIPCTPPSNLTLMPTGGVASPGIGTCLKTETFCVTADGTSPVSYTWTITPPPGASATPPNGAVVGAPSSGNPACFTSTLRGEGVYRVQVCATNGCSGTPPPCITIDYTLRDQTPPVLVVPPDTTVDCDSVPPAPVLSAQDNCDPDPTENYSELIISGACDGIYDIRRTWEAIDRSGNTTGPITQVVHVVDDEGPQVVPNPGVYQACMWPPNHVMHCFSAVDFDPVILDNCSLPVTWQVVSVNNSEEQLDPCGDGNQDPDWTISPDGLTFCVRSERCGNDPAENDGRVYSIIIRATDACGNASLDTAAFAILIPHDMSDHSDCIEP